MGHYSNFLFAEPSFTEGVARIFDVGGALQLYNESRNPEEADALALYADWRAVGNEIRHAARKMSRKLRGRSKKQAHA